MCAADALWLELASMEADPNSASSTEAVAFVYEGVAIRFGVPDHPVALGSLGLTELAAALRPLLMGL
jgi:hypothetical protein